MKKTLALLLMLATLVCVFASCGGGDSIVGTWVGEQDGVSVEFTFNKDGTGKFGSMGFDMDCTWETKDGKLYVSASLFGETEEIMEGAEYSVDGDKLTITEDGEAVVLKRK